MSIFTFILYYFVSTTLYSLGMFGIAFLIKIYKKRKLSKAVESGDIKFIRIEDLIDKYGSGNDDGDSWH